MGKTLRRYLVREIGGAFLAGIAIFSSILFLLRALGLLEMIFARGVPSTLVLHLMVAILPSFLEATLPMAFLLGVVTAFGRMASDQETMALRAAGLSLWQVLPPVLALSVLVAAATLVLSMTARPWGHREIEKTLFEMAKTRASAALKPRFFNTDFEHMVVYVDHIEPGSGDLVGVLLSDERSHAERSTVFASRGHVGGHEESGSLFLQLLDGTSVSSRDHAEDYDVTKFRSLEVNLELRTATGNKPASDEPAALSWKELRRDLAGDKPGPAKEAAIEEQRRFSISAAAFALALLGTALGMHPSPTTRGRAVGISIAAILAFYVLLTLAVAIARTHDVSPVVALWTPDALLAASALWALSRAAGERPFFASYLRPRTRTGLVR